MSIYSDELTIPSINIEEILERILYLEVKMFFLMYVCMSVPIIKYNNAFSFQNEKKKKLQEMKDSDFRLHTFFSQFVFPASIKSYRDK